MKTALLRKVQKHIDEEPKRLVMGDWVQRKGHATDTVVDNESDECQVHAFPPCNTAACIAGWAVLLSDQRPKSDVEKQAAKLLDLEVLGPNEYHEGRTEAERLFYVSNWPENYRRRYEEAKSPRGKATVAVQRIDHFIKTKGAA